MRRGALLVASVLALVLAASFTGPASARSASEPAQTEAVPMALAPIAPSSGLFHAVTPARILDTRSGLGGSTTLGAGQSIALPVTGVGGVQRTGASAVVLTVTVTRPAGPGYITVYPDGSARPVVSNLDFLGGETVANAVVVSIGGNGSIRLFNGSAGRVDLLVDVAGFYVARTPSIAGAFQPVTPSRLLDTRDGTGTVAAARLGANKSVNLKVTGRGGIPTSGVSAVIVTVTATRSVGSGFVTVYPDGISPPGVSNLNYSVGRSVPNLVVATVGSNGYVRLLNGGGGPVDLIVDVAGYYLSGLPGPLGAYVPISSSRLLDTRTGLGATVSAPVGGNSTTDLQVTGRGGVPSKGVSSVVVNVTAVLPTAAGYITAYPNGASRPTASNMDFIRGRTVANLVMIPVGANGRIRLFNGGAASLNLVVDVVGYHVDGTGAAGCNGIGPNPAGTNITQWNPVVLCVLAALGQSASNVNDVDTIILYESSGDPNAINLYDSNAQAGHPSEGLIQVIRPTFDEFRSLQLPNNLYDPAANLFAGLHYALVRYGSIHNVPGLVSLRAGGKYVGYIVQR